MNSKLSSNYSFSEIKSQNNIQNILDHLRNNPIRLNNITQVDNNHTDSSNISLLNQNKKNN